jgi:hypothetical protein
VTFPAISSPTDVDSSDHNTANEIEPLHVLPDSIFDGIRDYNAVIFRALSDVLARAEGEESPVRFSTSSSSSDSPKQQQQEENQLSAASARNLSRYQPLHASLSRQELAKRIPPRRVLINREGAVSSVNVNREQQQATAVGGNNHNIFLRMSGHTIVSTTTTTNPNPNSNVADASTNPGNSFASFDHWRRHVQSLVGPLESLPFFLLQYSDEGGTCGFLYHVMYGEEESRAVDEEESRSSTQHQRGGWNRNNQQRPEVLSFAARRRMLTQIAASIKKSEMELLGLLKEFFHFMKDVLAVVQFCERIWPAYLFQNKQKQQQPQQGRNPQSPFDSLRDLSSKLNGLVVGFCRKLTALDFGIQNAALPLNVFTFYLLLHAFVCFFFFTAFFQFHLLIFS